MLTITKHAVERYYERILKQPIPLETNEKLVEKLQAEINEAYLKTAIGTEVKFRINVGVKYKAVIKDNTIVTISYSRKRDSNREPKLIKEIKNKRKKYVKYRKGKRTY
jgi:hypothetical protein